VTHVGTVTTAWSAFAVQMPGIPNGLGDGYPTAGRFSWVKSPHNVATTPGGEAVRVLNWNIRNGGGSRIPAIWHHIEDANPDLLALTEFQTRNEPSLRAHLKRLGYPFIMTSNPMANRNGLLIASKWRLDHAADQYEPDIDRERWLAVRLNDLDLDVLVLHIPGTPDNKFEDGYGISGAKRKELLWECIITYAAAHKDRRAIMMGDFNTGFRIDAEGTMFKKSHYMTNLIGTGFVDTWRNLHPYVREYTWYSKRKDKTTEKSEDLNGFRLDYIFVSPALQDAIANAAILHEPRTAGTSDHSSVVANIDIQEGAYRILPHREISTAATGNDDSGGGQIGGTIDAEDRRVGAKITPLGNLQARFDIAPGSLSDLTCGLNGQNLVQQFRPTHFTAQWAGGVLKEVRIWGPRLLQDGSLGKRELDHQWKGSVADGGVKYSDLPPSVAARLRSYITANHLAVPPQ
jgi:exonuclease III